MKAESIEVRPIDYARLRQRFANPHDPVETNNPRALDLEQAYHDGVRRGRAAFYIGYIMGAAAGALGAALIALYS